MNEIQTANAVAAIWFTVYFGLCLLIPVFQTGCKAARRNLDKREENEK